jgi:hypothetical protein
MKARISGFSACIALVILTLQVGTIVVAAQQARNFHVDYEPRYATLQARRVVDGVDNYPYATFSFKHGTNGPAAVELTRNNWDLQFRDGPDGGSFEVTMVTDDRSRIRHLGALGWGDSIRLPSLPAHEKPTREPGVPAIVGHMYMVHTADRDNDHYALFRVESLEHGRGVTISWMPTVPPAEPDVTEAPGTDGMRVVNVSEAPKSVVAIADIKSDDVDRQPGERFNGGPNWVKNISLKLRNTTEKPIIFITLNVNFPETRSVGNLMSYPLQFGEMPGVPPGTSKPKQLRLEPGGTVGVDLATEFERIRKFVSSRYPLESVNEVQLEIGFVVFGDNTGWAAGNFLQQDPKDPRRWYPLTHEPAN